MPCTFLIIVTGLVFGALAQAMVGSMTAAVSNCSSDRGRGRPGDGRLEHVGSLPVVGKKYPSYGVRDIVLLGIVLGMAYTFLMDFSSWIVFYRAVPSLFIRRSRLACLSGAAHNGQRHLRPDTREAGADALQALPAALPRQV